MKRKISHVLISIVYLVATGLILYWFDWRLLLVMIAFGWAMNLDNKRKRQDEEGNNYMG
jgi:hypothetical protein